MSRRFGPAPAARGHFLVLIGVLLVAFFLRSYLLDKQSLWTDEAYTLSLATRASWQAIMEEVLAGDPYTPHTPLYYLALLPWLGLAGSSDFALRWLSVAFGLLTVPVSFVLARRLTNMPVAIIVAALSALSPFLVYYSQEARMYAMAGFLSTLAVYSYVRGVMGGKRRWWVAYSLSAIALIFTLNIGLVLIAVLFIAPFLPRPYGAKVRFSSVLSHIFIGLLFLAWQAVQSTRFQMVLSPAPFEAFGLLALDALKDNVLAHTFGVTLDRAWAVDRVYTFRSNPLQPWDRLLQPHYTTALAIGALGLALAGAWRLARERSPALRFFIPGIAAVAVSVYIIRLTTPGYAVRLTLIAAPLFLLLLAAGLLSLPRLLRISVVALVVLGMSYSLWQNYQNPVFSRSDYRTLAQYLGEELEQGDGVYLHGPVSRLLHSHYATRPQPTYSIPRSIPVMYNWGEVETQLKSLTEQHQRLWLVLVGEGDYDRDRRVERWLLERGYQVEDQWFGNARLALFVFPRHNASKAFAARDVDSSLALEGSAFQNDQTFTPGQGIPIALTGKRLSVSTEQYRLSLRVTDPDQAVWAQRDLDLGTHVNPVSQWPVDQPVTVKTGLRLPPGIPPGSYLLKVLVYTPKGGPLPGGQLDPITVRVTSGPPGLARHLRPPNKVEIPLSPLRLLGYYFPQEVRPGGAALLRLYWEAKRSPKENYSLAVRLGTGPVVELPLLPGYPTSRWRDGEALVSQHMIRVPAAAKGTQPLSIGLAGQSDTQLLPLTDVQVANIERVFAEPSMQRTYQVSLGGRAELLGMDVRHPENSSDTVALTPGGSLDLSIYWKALKEMNTSYTVFVQVLDANGRLVVTQDAVPANGQRPTTGWLPGEVLQDRHSVKVPRSIAPGRYSVIAGMYDAKTGNRLASNNQDFVSLASAIVTGD